MKELLKQYAAYNYWAHNRLFELILQLPAEKQQTEITSSFNGLLKTILHCWDAEAVWWQRVKLQERILFPGENFQGDLRDACSGLLMQSKQWEDWVANASELSIDHVFQFYNTKKELVKMPVYQVVLHVFNHGTYHLGQLVTMLRQLGVDKIPSTDFSTWVRGKK
jgi:uncharacterized damage-inducible protein DinB